MTDKFFQEEEEIANSNVASTDDQDVYHDLIPTKFIDIDKEVGERTIFGTWNWQF